MIEVYKFDKIAGPSGLMAGYILLFFGLVTVYFTFTAIPVFLLGGLMAFSFNGTRIHFEKKRYQTYFALFGFIRIGVWLPFEKSDTISVVKFKGKYTTYSKSNRKTEVDVRDFRIILNTSYNDKNITMAQFQNEQEAKKKAEELVYMIDALKI